MYVSSAGFGIVRRMPVAWASALGASLARRFAVRQMPVRAARAADSLAALLPDASAAERAAILDRRWANMGRFLFELPAIMRLVRGDAVVVDAPDAFARLVTEARPTVFVSLHIGNWELLGAWLAMRIGRTGLGVFQPPDDPRQAAMLARVREAYAPLMLAPGDDAAKRLSRHLAETPRALAYVLLDERRSRQVAFPSFGRAGGARGNVAAVLRMARTTGALVVPSYLERLGGGRFALRWHEPVDLRRQPIGEAITLLDKWFGAAALRLVDQWLALQDITLRREDILEVNPTRSP